jgi:predicted site-specific integrase-resolvase
MNNDVDDPDAYVSIKQAMAIVGVGRRTMYNWMDAGKVTFKLTAGGGRRILVSSLWQTTKPRREPL